MKRPASYRVLKFWKEVPLRDMPFHTTFFIVPEQKIRSDEMSDTLFDAIVKAVQASNCDWEVYSIDKKMIETSIVPAPAPVVQAA